MIPLSTPSFFCAQSRNYGSIQDVCFLQSCFLKPGQTRQGTALREVRQSQCSGQTPLLASQLGRWWPFTWSYSNAQEDLRGFQAKNQAYEGSQGFAQVEALIVAVERDPKVSPEGAP